MRRGAPAAALVSLGLLGLPGRPLPLEALAATSASSEAAAPSARSEAAAAPAGAVTTAAFAGEAGGRGMAGGPAGARTAAASPPNGGADGRSGGAGLAAAGMAGSPTPAVLTVPAVTTATAPVPAPIPAQGLRLTLEEGVEARMSADGQISVTALPHRGEGLAAFALRLCGDTRRAGPLMAANGHSEAGAAGEPGAPGAPGSGGAAGPSAAAGRGGGRAAEGRSGRRQRAPNDLLTGHRYLVPFELLSPAWQLRAARALFPGDHGDATGWRHQVRGLGALRRENLWQLSEWFTGKGENFRAIREYNRLRDEDITQGAVLTIPSELLRPAFGAALPVPQRPFALDYGRDDQGEYAAYRLHPGEALYSAVVVRFTGRIYAADVNALAAEIAHRNGIEDVTDIPVGYQVKIPLDLLLPEYLPEGDARRKEYEAGLRASSQFSNQVRARGLEGITVILDAGHGGHDSGATMGGVWESLYVYDIVVRLKGLLEARTAARVLLTTRDGDDFRVVDADVLPESRHHAVLTTPPYPIADPVVGVNLRWYLANSYFRRAVAADNDPQKVVFLSIHADSLHPSLRGAMAYIPAARMRDESYGKSGSIYEARQEFRESPRVEFPWSQRVQSEGLSRQLAKQVIGAFEELSLPVDPFTPVRDHIIRSRSEWVPAVLRYNSVPAKMLLEVCNLNNDLDRRLLQTRTYRQRVADAVVQGLLAYYGQSASQPGVRLARSSSK